MATQFGITLAALKSFLGYDEDDESRDVQLQVLLDSSFSTLRQLTGRKLIRGTYKDTLESYPDKVYLREFPIESVSDVSIGGASLPVDDYLVFKDSGCIHFYAARAYGHRWFTRTTGGWPQSLLTITYVAGYATLPGDMIMAVYNGIQAADMLLKQALRYGGFAKAISVQDVGSVDLVTPKDYSLSAMQDAMNAQLGPLAYNATTLGAPLLHESEYLGPAP